MANTSDEQKAWERSPGYVYFIAAGDPPAAIKIGITKKSQLRRRLATIQGCNHEPLRIVGVIVFCGGKRPMKEAESAESELHNRFRHIQRFEQGWAGSEWFNATPELISFIKEHATLPSEPGLQDAVAKIGPGIESGAQRCS